MCLCSPYGSMVLQKKPVVTSHPLGNISEYLEPLLPGPPRSFPLFWSACFASAPVTAGIKDSMLWGFVTCPNALAMISQGHVEGIS